MKDFLKALFSRITPKAAIQDRQAAKECCSNLVHIAYRGVSDDHLYMAYNRQSSEVKFFRPNGLRTFCAACRKRIL